MIVHRTVRNRTKLEHHVWKIALENSEKYEMKAISDNTA